MLLFSRSSSSGLFLLRRADGMLSSARIIAPLSSASFTAAVTPAAPPGLCRPSARSDSSPVSSELQRSFI